MAKAAVEQDTPDVTDRIAAVLEKLAENTPVKEIGFGHPEYQQRLRDEGFYTAFAAPVFQNGREAQARGLKPETIERAPKLKAGKYLGGKVEVVRDNRDLVHLLYKNAKVEDRMRFQAIVRDFDDLIEKLWNEQAAAAA